MDKRERQYYLTGRLEAKRLFPIAGIKCAECPSPATDHHHVDGDTHNNTPFNVVLMCHRCHLRKERQGLFVGSRTRLSRTQIERIKGQELISKLAIELDMSEPYLRRIRNGEKNPKPVDEDLPFVIPVDWRWRELRGKRRALTVEQVHKILSYNPTLGTANAVRLSKRFSVNVSTIWKARARKGCYADVLYD